MKLFSTLLASLCLATPALATETREWSYKQHDAKYLSPSEWGLEYPTCDGQRQSPVDVKTGGRCGKNIPLVFSGACDEFVVKETTEAYKLEVQNSTCTVSANSVAYPFAQFHVHAPSEHTLNGKAHDGELHFVHKNAAGNIAVVGVFLEQKLLGKTDPFVSSVLDGLRRTNTTNPVEIELPSYAALVNAHLKLGLTYNYPGSLTTPGCDEVVDWWVLSSPLTISTIDLARLYTYLEKIEITELGRNARPTQALNGRTFTAY
ncbi:Carbonic anhydrase [Globisporangium polare]